jgi:hypothetical protein
MNFLGPYKYVVDFLIIAALVGLAALGIHKYNAYQQDIGEARVQAAWTAERLAQAEAKRAREIQFQKEKDDAIAQAAKNVQVATAAAAAATQSSRVLDDTLKAILARSGSDSVEANRKYTATIAAVFADCKDKYRELGREAQGHADDSLMYQNAWPAQK